MASESKVLLETPPPLPPSPFGAETASTVATHGSNPDVDVAGTAAPGAEAELKVLQPRPCPREYNMVKLARLMEVLRQPDLPRFKQERYGWVAANLFSDEDEGGAPPGLVAGPDPVP